VKLGLTAIALAAFLNLTPSTATAAFAQQQAPVPDLPAPQAPPPLQGANGTPITPGKGAGNETANTTGFTSGASSTEQTAPGSLAPSTQGRDDFQAKPPEMPAAGEAVEKQSTIIRLNVNYVEVPVTVKDTKGKLVAGLTFRDFKVYENTTREPLAFFTVDPFPLSVAFVIDQSLTSDVMAKVNASLTARRNAPPSPALRAAVSPPSWPSPRAPAPRWKFPSAADPWPVATSAKTATALIPTCRKAVR
jgi:hypothetical protein